MRRWLTTLLLLSLWLFGAPTPTPGQPGGAAGVPLPAAEGDRVLERIRTTAENLQQFSAAFVQHRQSRLLRNPLVSEGLIYFVRGGKMLIAIDKPSPFKIRIEDERLEVIRPSAGVVQRSRLAGAARVLGDLLALGGPSAAWPVAAPLRRVAADGAERYVVTLTPSPEAGAPGLAAVEITVDAGRLLPQRIHLQQTDGDFTTLELEFLTVNTPLPPEIFAIEPAEATIQR